MKWQIGVKSKAVDKNAHVVTYQGRSYYRLYRTGDTDNAGQSNTVATSAIHPYYPPCTSLHPQLSTNALSAGSAELGHSVLEKNDVVTIPAVKQWVQIEFKGTRHGDYGLLKFEKPGSYGGFFTKTIRQFNNNLIFDFQGNDEKIFTIGTPDETTFYTDSGTYCIKYTGINHVFVVQSQPGVIYTPPGVTPTPTPTPTAATPGSRPTGDKYWSTANWPASAMSKVLMWYDSAYHTSLSAPNGIPIAGSAISKWVDRSVNAYEVDGRSTDNWAYAPTYRATGTGVNGGPGLHFTQRFRDESSMLIMNTPGQGFDYRATFVVCDTPNDFIRGNPEQGLITGATSDGGIQAAGGFMFTVENFNNHWAAVDLNCPGVMCTRRSTIYSDTFSTGDAGQYYVNGLPVPDDQPIVPKTGGVIYEGIRTSGIPAYINGLCIGSHLALTQGIEKAWRGNIGEIIILNDEPTTIEREEIEGYLAWKWGLVPFLPVDHRWKNEPPHVVVPTPLPKPPDTPVPTETATQPPPPPLPPVGIDVVSTQQLFDTLTSRQGSATLWTGGMYQQDWASTKSKLQAISSNDTIVDLIIESNRYVASQIMSMSTLNASDRWHASGYDQMDVDCPGSGDTTIRHPYPDNWADNTKSRLMYCLGAIMSGERQTSDMSIFKLLSDNDWRKFTTAIMNPTSSNVAAIEAVLQHVMILKNISYNFNHIDVDLPSTPIYQLKADPTRPYPHQWASIQGIEFDNMVSRYDIAIELMYDTNSHLFWHKPVQIEDTTVEITVDLPGLNADQGSYTNTGDLRWKVNVEIGDSSAHRAMYSSTMQELPVVLPEYIADSVNNIEIPSIDGCNYKITPYMGNWPGANSDAIVQAAADGVFPKLLCRVDREILL